MPTVHVLKSSPAVPRMICGSCACRCCFFPRITNVLSQTANQRLPPAPRLYSPMLLLHLYPQIFLRVVSRSTVGFGMTALVRKAEVSRRATPPDLQIRPMIQTRLDARDRHPSRPTREPMPLVEEVGVIDRSHRFRRWTVRMAQVWPVTLSHLRTWVSLFVETRG